MFLLIHRLLFGPEQEVVVLSLIIIAIFLLQGLITKTLNRLLEKTMMIMMMMKMKKALLLVIFHSIKETLLLLINNNNNKTPIHSPFVPVEEDIQKGMTPIRQNLLINLMQEEIIITMKGNHAPFDIMQEVDPTTTTTTKAMIFSCLLMNRANTMMPFLMMVMTMQPMFIQGLFI